MDFKEKKVNENSFLRDLEIILVLNFKIFLYKGFKKIFLKLY